MERLDREKMSRERILDAALELVDRDGIAGLSMRKLGAELGVEAMTLYYYVPNKNALLDGLIERGVAHTFTAFSELIGERADWVIWLRDFAVALRRELLLHPRLLPLIATRPAMTPAAMHVVERIAAALCQIGFSPQRAFHVINTITTFVIGHTLAEAGATPGHEGEVDDLAELQERLDSGAFPCFQAAVCSGLGQAEDHQSRFDFALDALFAGMAMQLQGPPHSSDEQAGC